MKPIKLIIRTKTEKYPVLIGRNLVENLSNLFSQNSINSKKRPLAFNSSRNRLLEIINKRSQIYSKALYKINCENCTKQEIAKKIIQIYETN